MWYEIVADKKAGVRVVLNKARLGSDAPLGEYASLGEAEAFVKTVRELDALGASPVRMPRRLDALPVYARSPFTVRSVKRRQASR